MKHSQFAIIETMKHCVLTSDLVYIVNLSDFAAKAESTSVLVYVVSFSAFPGNAESKSVSIDVVD